MSVTVLATMLSAQSAPQRLAVGDPAPPLTVARWLDEVPPFAGAAGRFGGEAAMLVFWAPWCGACVAEFPHLNELVAVAATEKLPLAIVSIASGAEDEVAALLAKRPLRTHRAIDDSGATFAAYGVRVLPRIVLIDPAGTIAALPKLGDVDAEVLRRLARGEALSLPTAGQVPADLEWDRGRTPFDTKVTLAHVVVEPSAAVSGAVSFPQSGGRITADGVAFANLLQIAFDAGSHQVQATHAAYGDTTARYRVSVKAHDDSPDTARAMLRDQLARLIPFVAEWTEVQEPTPVLCRNGDGEPEMIHRATATKASGEARAGRIAFEKVTMARIAETIGAFAFGKAMIDETGLDGVWNVCIEWTPGDAPSLVQALARCGLEYRMAPRQVRKLRVREP